MKEQPAWLVEREIIIDGHSIIYSYDKEGDVLEIIFQKGGGIGIDLTDNIVLRYNQDRQEPLSLILTSFSHLTQPTPFGPPSFQLTALNELPLDMQQTILLMLNTFPVNRFLKISGLRLSPDSELQPITYFEQPTDLQLNNVAA